MEEGKKLVSFYKVVDPPQLLVLSLQANSTGLEKYSNKEEQQHNFTDTGPPIFIAHI